MLFLAPLFRPNHDCPSIADGTLVPLISCCTVEKLTLYSTGLPWNMPAFCACVRFARVEP